MTSNLAAVDSSSADVSRPRGRPREFDLDEVLDQLVELFWDRGYEGASLNEIVEAAGLNKSSIYNAFGSKDELFFRVLDRYLDGRQSLLDQACTPGGLEVIESLLEMMRFEVTEAQVGRGCLAVNASTELGLRNDQVAALAERYRGLMRGVMRGPLETAAERGEIDPQMVDVYADTLVSFGVALVVAARSGAERAELNRQVDGHLALVRSWRVS